MAVNSTVESPLPTIFSRLAQLDGPLDVYTVGVATSALILLTTFASQLIPRKDKDGFPFLSGLPIVGSWKFFTKRYNFLHEGIAKLGQTFSFKILQVCMQMNQVRYSANNLRSMMSL